MIIPNHTPVQGEDINLAERITFTGSKQTYFTFRFLVDRDRRQIAYNAYAYFRWLDDLIDNDSSIGTDNRAFIGRQQALMDACYRGESTPIQFPEERMLVDLVNADQQQESGLQVYLRNMMKVLAFDVERRGRLISRAALTEYTHWLARAVTEALFYFIGYRDFSPYDEKRYHAVCGSHVVHMLRDCFEDITAGYINIPSEYLPEGKISIDQLHSLPMRRWVYGRIRLARQYFANGRKYFSHVKSFRCRLACNAYLARFEWMVNRIERDGYRLRQAYPERKSFKAALWMAWRVLASSLKISWSNPERHEQTALIEPLEE